MAKITRDLAVGLCTSKHEEVATVSLPAGTEVEIIKEWDRFWLIKDADGHFFNLPKDAVAA